jgi:hypothetical protein
LVGAVGFAGAAVAGPVVLCQPFDGFCDRREEKAAARRVFGLFAGVDELPPPELRDFLRVSGRGLKRAVLFLVLDVLRGLQLDLLGCIVLRWRWNLLS